MSQQRYVTVQKRGANHGLHLVLTFCTFGLWAVTGWPIAAMLGRRTKTVNYGPQQLPYQSTGYSTPVQMQQGAYVPQPGAQPYYPPPQVQQPYPPQPLPPYRPGWVPPQQ